MGTLSQEAGSRKSSRYLPQAQRGDAISDPTTTIATKRMARSHSPVLARVNILGKSIFDHVSPLIHSGEERRELTLLTSTRRGQQWEEPRMTPPQRQSGRGNFPS